MKNLLKFALPPMLGMAIIYKLGVLCGAIEAGDVIEKKTSNKVSKISVGIFNNKVDLELTKTESE